MNPIRTGTAEKNRLGVHAAVNLLCDLRLVADDRDLAARACHRPDPTGPTVVALATAAARIAIEHIYGLPVDAVTVEMHAATITLTGQVSSAGDRLAVEIAISYLAGNHSITNQILVLDGFDQPLSRTAQLLPILDGGSIMSNEDKVHDDAWRDDTRQSQPGGMAASGTQSEGGGDGYEEGRTHTGWGPADGELADKEAAEEELDHQGRSDHDAWRDDTRQSQPGGMAASGTQSEGGGDGYEEGRTHTGWGPADGELADKEAARHTRPPQED